MAFVVYPEQAASFTTSRNLQYGYAYWPQASSNDTNVVFLHGFPSSSADWSSQIQHQVAHKRGAVAIDLLGYGQTSKPESVDSYSTYSMANDIAELLVSIDIKSAHFVAHDVGCQVLSRLVVFHEALVKSATFLAVPFDMPGSAFDIHMVKQITKKLLGFESFGHVEYLARNDTWKTLDEKPASLESVMLSSHHWRDFYPTGALEAWMASGKQATCPTWISSDWSDPVRRAKILGNGYLGPTNWYRSLVSNMGIEEEKVALSELGRPSDYRFKAPIMFVDHAESETSMPSPPMDGTFTNFRVKNVSTTGHWIMLENPSEVNDLLQEFFREVEST